jgi:exonuclease III
MRSRLLVVLAALALAGCSAQASPAPWVISAAATPTPAASPSPTDAASPAPSASPEPSPSAGPATVDLKVMDFNIEYGGTRVDFAKIVEAVKTADPDVVALEEAQGNTERLAEGAGYPYANIRNQVISKFPIIDPPGADGRYVYIEVAPGSVVAVSNVHLPSDPYGPYDVRDGKTAEEVIALETETRLPAIQQRLDVLPDLVDAGIPTFLTGDFNAPSHLDWTEAAVGLRPHMKYALAWPVSTAVEAAGFKDAYRELHPDPVADPGLTWWAARPAVPDDDIVFTDPEDRIDLILAAGDATPTDVKIIGEKGGPQVDIEIDPWGTDHRSVMATFAVVPGTAAPYVAVDQRLVTFGQPLSIRYHDAAFGTSTLPIDRIGVTGQPITIFSLPAPTTTDGTVEVDTEAARLRPGDYQVRLVSGSETVSTTTFSIAAPGADVTLAAGKPSYAVGEPIDLTWRDAPGSRWDWIGIYKRGGDPLVDSLPLYVYTDQGVQGSVLVDENALPWDIEWPLPAGDYDAHYLLDDGYESLASTPFTVTK